MLTDFGGIARGLELGRVVLPLVGPLSAEWEWEWARERECEYVLDGDEGGDADGLFKRAPRLFTSAST